MTKQEMKCKRCGANENRIHGFCSIECETAWEYEDDIRDLTARIAELKAEIERLTAHSDIERQDDKCSGHGDISNFPPVMGSGDGLGW